MSLYLRWLYLQYAQLADEETARDRLRRRRLRQLRLLKNRYNKPIPKQHKENRPASPEPTSTTEESIDIKEECNNNASLEHFFSPEFECHSCKLKMNSCQYVCIQCIDVNICAACEYMGRHPDHYVVRIPTGKPSVEVEVILSKLRTVMNTEEDPLYPENLDIKDEEETESEMELSGATDSEDIEQCVEEQVDMDEAYSEPPEMYPNIVEQKTQTSNNNELIATKKDIDKNSSPLTVKSEPTDKVLVNQRIKLGNSSLINISQNYTLTEPGKSEQSTPSSTPNKLLLLKPQISKLTDQSNSPLSNVSQNYTLTEPVKSEQSTPSSTPNKLFLLKPQISKTTDQSNSPLSNVSQNYTLTEPVKSEQSTPSSTPNKLFLLKPQISKLTDQKIKKFIIKRVSLKASDSKKPIHISPKEGPS